MAVTGLVHHFGTFMLFSAVILLVITNITAPVVHNISLLRIDLNDAQGQHNPALTFGTFGHCFVDAPGGDDCSPSMVGYDPAEVINERTGLNYYSTAAGTARALTRVMILHPIAAGVAFIAFALSLGAGTFGSLLASLAALLAFFVTLVPLVTDFVMFGIIRSGINDNRNVDARAQFGAGLWTLLAAAVLLLVGTVIVFLTCCSARIHRRRDARVTKAVDGYAPAEAPRRRKWF
ncbi:hypothetical protein RB594_001646 [Gaeumannomyces avenae]